MRGGAQLYTALSKAAPVSASTDGAGRVSLGSPKAGASVLEPDVYSCKVGGGRWVLGVRWSCGDLGDEGGGRCG
jgi:hypothetical protein